MRTSHGSWRAACRARHRGRGRLWGAILDATRGKAQGITTMRAPSPRVFPARFPRRRRGRGAASSPVAFEDEVPQREERVLRARGSDALQLRERRGHELLRRLARALEVGRDVDRGAQRRARILDRRVEEQPLQLARALGPDAREESDHGERHLAFGEVGAERLADAALVAGEVEAVVDDLEGEPDEPTVLLERRALLRRSARVPRAEPGARGVERRGLVLDDAQVLLEAQVEA